MQDESFSFIFLKPKHLVSNSSISIKVSSKELHKRIKEQSFSSELYDLIEQVISLEKSRKLL